MQIATRKYKCSIDVLFRPGSLCESGAGRRAVRGRVERSEGRMAGWGGRRELNAFGNGVVSVLFRE